MNFNDLLRYRPVGAGLMETDGEGPWVRYDGVRELLREIHDLLWRDQPVCCGQTVEGGSYMGMSEAICCGNPDWHELTETETLRRLRLLVSEDSVPSDEIPY